MISRVLLLLIIFEYIISESIFQSRNKLGWNLLVLWFICWKPGNSMNNIRMIPKEFHLISGNVNIDNNWNDNKKQIFFKCRTSIFMNEISSSLIDTYFYDLDWVKIKGNQNENEIVFKKVIWCNWNEYFALKLCIWWNEHPLYRESWIPG